MRNKYTETSLETKIGTFMLRVYKDTQGKETVVMYTGNLNTQRSVLVRIHSECLTGDIFKSLKCDCGDQLELSLRMIHDSGNGAVIYLRQEGRGIGLFEKVQTYQLQHKGYDTYDANIMLGHGADERTYEWARIALKDLGIHEIKLLTNNPSKVSLIENLGIKVIERIPLIIKSNKYNQRYFEAKRDKFNHYYTKEI